MLKNSRGVSLIELVVGMAILTITVSAGLSSFKFITQAIQQSRQKTIATNLAQEKMESLKNINYFQLLVTTSPYTDPTYGVQYDLITYSSETISLWGLPAFTRAVYVSYVDMSTGTAVLISPTSVDPGLKEIFVYVFWREGGTNKQVLVNSFMANPTASTMDASIQGTVTISSPTPPTMAGATVEVVGNPNWRAVTDSVGHYSFQVAHGTYSLLCSSAGFYSSEISALSVDAGYTVDQDFEMVKIASGNILTTVWISSNILISNVVASTVNENGTPVEFIELYNPTTYTWTIADDLSAPVLTVVYQEAENTGIVVTSLTYVNRAIPSFGYYLISSTDTPVTINGSTRAPDAYYFCTGPGMMAAGCLSSGNNIIKDDTSGGVGVGITASGVLTDKLGWTDTGVCNLGSGSPAGLTEGTCRDTGGLGLGSNAQYVRMTGTGTALSGNGRAYDSDNNFYNFQYKTGANMLAPNNTSVREYPYTGFPAYGAIAAANDLLSSPARAETLQTATYPYAQIYLTNVATGTWTVEITSGAYMLTVATVTVANSADTTWMPNSTTVSTWPVSGRSTSILTSTTSGGFIQGYVYGAGSQYWSPLANILIECNNRTTRTTSGGYFFLNVDTGTYAVNANYNGDNSLYSDANYTATIAANEIVDVPGDPWFHLPQSGKLKGYVSSGTGALPGIVVRATDGSNTYEAPSDETGYFYITASTSAAPYTLTPSLGPEQSATSAPSSPLQALLTVPNSTVFAGTITVSGGMGEITGRVTASGNAITTGVLVVASVGTVNDPPGTIYASSAAALTNAYYSISSQADGYYHLPVPAGTYNMRAFYPVVDVITGNLTYTSDTLTGVVVVAAQIKSGQDFSW